MLELTDRTWLWIAAACYLGGFVLGTVAVLREQRHSRMVMYVIIAVGFAFQTFGLYQRGREVGGCPLGNTFEIFQFTAWSAIALYLVVGATFRLSLLGYFTSMLSAALTVVALAIPAWDATRRSGIFDNPWIEFHAALALFSYGVFGLLALTSVMYLMRHYSLQHKQLSGFFSFLPPIVDLDHISLRLLVTGTALLTASLAVGSAYWLRAPETVNLSKLFVTIAIGLAYAGALILRLRGSLVSRRLAWACIGLFIGALLSVPAVNASRHSTTTVEKVDPRP
jgi:HemX protein